MPSLFPGIDPYLEGRHFCEDFHPRFLTYCSDALNEILPQGYIGQLGERIRQFEFSLKRTKLVLPDIAVIEEAGRPSRRVAYRSRATGALTLEPVTIPLPSVETEVRDIWIEIRRGTSRAPVTVIEMLSPTNKTSDGLVEYQLKRRSLIRQKAHLVELDLLLGGRRLPMSLPLPAADDFAFVSRAGRRPDSEVYAWTIRDALPSILIPLQPNTPDVALDLAGVFATTYERGRYARLIDYTTTPSVLRKPEDRAWAEKWARRGAPVNPSKPRRAVFNRVMSLETPIGKSDLTSSWRTIASGLTAAAVVCADFWLVSTGNTSLIGLRTIPPVLALASYYLLYCGDLPAMGLRYRSIQGFRYWVIATALIGAAIGAFLSLALAIALLTGFRIRLYEIRPPELWNMFVQMCVLAPIFEEAIYRFGLCTGLVPVLKPWGTIGVSGTIFGVLHVLYGNPGPDNLIAGYFLAWAYLKSGTIVIPVVLHSLGNLFVVVMHFGIWYWHHGPA